MRSSRNLDPRRINLVGTLIDPEVFDGPLNVLIGLYGTATAANTVEETKRIYDENNPPVPPAAPPAPVVEPLGEPISPGKRIVPDASKYIIDTSSRDRVLRRPRG